MREMMFYFSIFMALISQAIMWNCISRLTAKVEDLCYYRKDFQEAALKAIYMANIIQEENNGKEE